jgi:hypothetical protein
MHMRVAMLPQQPERLVLAVQAAPVVMVVLQVEELLVQTVVVQLAVPVVRVLTH